MKRREDGHKKAVQEHSIAGSFVQPGGRGCVYTLLIKSPFLPQLFAWLLQTKEQLN